MITDPRLRALARAMATINGLYHTGALPLWWAIELHARALRAYREGTAMPELRTIEITPPQPCGILDPIRPGQICGQPANRATAEAAPRTIGGPAGYLLVLPICEACARALTRNYAIGLDTTPASAELLRRN